MVDIRYGGWSVTTNECSGGWWWMEVSGRLGWWVSEMVVVGVGGDCGYQRWWSEVEDQWSKMVVVVVVGSVWSVVVVAKEGE